MKNRRWLWLFVLAIPGCVLTQPLDKAAPSDDDDSSSSAGSDTDHAGSNSGHAGSGSGRAGGSAAGAKGSGGSSNADDTLTPFVGTWTATSGTLTVVCPGVDPQEGDVTGSETWSPGTDADLVAHDFEDTCDFDANVKGKTATGLSGQTCREDSTDSDGDSVTEVLTFTSLTFAVSSDGTTATQKFAGTDAYTDNTTLDSLACTFAETASFTLE